MTLTDFLIARINEDEEWARPARIERIKPAVHNNLGCRSEDVMHVVRHDPDRVLADCEAKRLVVAQYLEAMRVRDEPDAHAQTYVTMQTVAMALYPLVAKFAAVYADHPDYQDEWAPELTTA